MYERINLKWEMHTLSSLNQQEKLKHTRQRIKHSADVMRRIVWPLLLRSSQVTEEYRIEDSLYIFSILHV